MHEALLKLQQLSGADLRSVHFVLEVTLAPVILSAAKNLCAGTVTG